ncbi:MAG TPA: recombinase RecA [Armatimonadota bacterium]|nr:recombinase RecA [Armatimonadota bacterium]
MADALAGIEKQYGKGSIMRLGSAPRRAESGVIPTGSLSLDLALGIGGIPRGRIIEVYGQESSGKTTLVLHILANTQKLGGTVAFIDAEHALDPDYARDIGVNIDDLIVSQPDTGEQALEIADALVRSGAIDAVVVDSVAALVPRAEIEGEMGDSHVGLQARLMSQALRKLGGSLSRSNTAAIFTNQVREKIGVVYGNPEVTPGGRALKFWSSVRIEIRRGEALKRGTDILGVRVRLKVVKNKMAPPYRQAEFDLIYGRGISREGDLLDIGLEQKVLSRTGTWYSFGEQRLGQGRDNAREFLEQNPAVASEIEQAVLAAVGVRDARAPRSLDGVSEAPEEGPVEGDLE